MRLTAKSEYGLLAVIDLACSYGDGPISAREIAERRDIPPRFLEQLFVALRRGGVVSAVRGAHGGFVLTKAPEETSVLEVVEALEGALETSVCDSERSSGCSKSAACAAAPVWAKATAALRDVFATTSLAELAVSQSRMDSSNTTAE